MKHTLDENPLWLIWSLSSHLKHHIADFSEQHNLSPSQLHALLLLQPDTPVPMNQLSCLVGCDPSYTTGLVDKLVALDLVTRQESTQDRRIKTLTLNTQGVVLRADLIQQFGSFYKDLAISKHIPNTLTSELKTLSKITLEISRTK
ncbi:winged helix-turn-helix transcriptional regulator [Candidatus Saccharibacteria bacterium]|nr:winged helix-turn-helix transcriptional regulator [Candidatus Saccharibacteria bacterium]